MLSLRGAVALTSCPKGRRRSNPLVEVEIAYPDGHVSSGLASISSYSTTGPPRNDMDNNMQSSAKTVPAYIKEAPAARRETLKRLRDLCRATLTGFKESMQYGGPCYSRDGVVEVGFASQKNYIGLYTFRVRTDVMRSHRYLLNRPGITFGKGAIRYSKPEKIDFNVVEKMLRATVESEGEVC